MGNKKRWVALLTAFALLFCGNMELYAAPGDGLDDITAQADVPDSQYIGWDEDIPATDSTEFQVQQPEGLAPEDTVEEDGEQPGGLPEQQGGEQEALPDPEAAAEEEHAVRAVSAEGRYVFAVADPGQDNYREWQDLTVEIGEEHVYDFHFAWYENGAYEIISTQEFGMGIELFSMSQNPQFTLSWDGGGHQLKITPEYARTYTLSLTYTHPVSGQRVQEVLTLQIVKQKYFFVIAEPGSGNYRPWDDATVHVGDEARYVLQLASLKDGVYCVETEAEWGVLFQESEHFTLDLEEDGYYLNVSPTHTGTYAIKLYYVNPFTGLAITDALYLHVTVRSTDGDLFKVVAPDGAVTYWGDGEIGAATIYYNGTYDPEQTLTVSCREGFSLHDPEGILEAVSTDSGEVVYAMTRTSWESPCEFRSGDTVMALYVLLPTEADIRFVLYDEELAETAPATMPALADGMLVPGEEARVAVFMEAGGVGTLLADPLGIVRTNPPSPIPAEPGVRYFTIVPDEGKLTLGIQRGHSQTVWVGTKTAAELYVIKQGSQRYSLLDGDNVKSRIKVEAVSNYSAIPGMGPLFRSSNPDVIAVEPDELNNRRCYLTPVGYGEANIFLDSDEYYGQVLLTVTDWNITMTAIHQAPSSIGLPSGGIEWGPGILPENSFAGSGTSPFTLPCLTSAKIDLPALSPIDLWSYEGGNGIFASSDPGIVEVIQENCFEAYLNPVAPGVCTITYQEGPFYKEVVVRSEPGALEQVGCIDPGFYTYYGSAQVRRDAVSLDDGLPVVMAIAPTARSGSREALQREGFVFSDPGVAKVELTTDNLFNLVPLGNGTTTLTYTTQSGEVLQLHISVGLPEPVWDFVVPDDTASSGYRVWEGERAAVGDRLEHEVFFAQVVLAGNGDIHTLKLQDAPGDMAVDPQDGAVFGLEQRAGSWYTYASPQEAGEYGLSITATPAGAASAHTWEKRLYVSQPILVSENTVAAINEAIRTAPIQDSYETVILLPQGYIPMDGDTPVLLGRPVTLRGQNTVLASDVVALSTVPGAKLQNITIRFDDSSAYNGKTGFQNRVRYHFVFTETLDIDKLLFAVFGDGVVTLDNCVIDGGSGRDRCQYGIAAVGDGLTFQGANTIQNFTQAGWVLYSVPGPRRYFRGLTFTGNGIGVQAINMGSTDPYFIRLIESNFFANAINVESDFPVNFSNNYFLGGNDADNITKSPQYTTRLEFGADNTVIAYPNLRIEEGRLASTELLNFEGQAPISTDNFSSTGEAVQITVKELDDAGVGEEDSSNVLLQWNFAPATSTAQAPLFRPDAYIHESFALPPDSGIETYQGVSFAHHGPLPMEGATISVLKKTLFTEETLYLYRLEDGVLAACGEIDNTAGEFYTFHLDGCSDYVITNVVVEFSGGTPGGGDGGNGGTPGGGDGGNGGTPGGGDGGDGGTPGGGDGGNGGTPGGGDGGNGGTPGGSDGGDGGTPGGGDGGNGGTPGGGDGDDGGTPGGGDGGNGGTPGGGDGGNGGTPGGNGNRSSAENEDNDFSDEGPGVAATPDNLPISTPPGTQPGSTPDRGGPRPANERQPGTGRTPTNAVPGSIYEDSFSHIPAPVAPGKDSRGAPANLYVDEATVRAAFHASQDQQVVIDVGVRTTVSSLAFQLLAENPTYTLVLKGDGYEWRFSGESISAIPEPKPFDTAVSWRKDEGEGVAQLAFAQQGAFPGACALILESRVHPQEWAQYSTTQKAYAPCSLSTRLQGERLIVELDKLGSYVAILPAST